MSGSSESRSTKAQIKKSDSLRKADSNKQQLTAKPKDDKANKAHKTTKILAQRTTSDTNMKLTTWPDKQLKLDHFTEFGNKMRNTKKQETNDRAGISGWQKQ